MPTEQSDFSRMTPEELLQTMARRKQERSRRLAQLPFTKKIEIVGKFTAILNEALREDEKRRALEAESSANEG